MRVAKGRKEIRDANPQLAPGQGEAKGERESVS